jgi:hypothetical protein
MPDKKSSVAVPAAAQIPCTDVVNPGGYTKIPNVLLDAILQTDFSKRQRKIIDLIIRTSLGCGKSTSILRASDYEAAGVSKTKIRDELEQLVSLGVVVSTPEGVRIADPPEWDAQTRGHKDRQAKLNRAINYNLAVPKTGTKVPKMGTQEFPKREQKSSQNGNPEVPKTGTDSDLEPLCHNGFGASKENVKEILNNVCITPLPPVSSIFARYTPDQKGEIITYWKHLENESGEVIPDTTRQRIMTRWEQYPLDVVLDAINIHVRSCPGKKESYTLGIMRRLAAEAAAKEVRSNEKNNHPERMGSSALPKNRYSAIDLARFAYRPRECGSGM